MVFILSFSVGFFTMPIIHTGDVMSTHFKDRRDDYFYPRIPDWPQVIEDIKESAGSYSVICKILGVGWPAVQGWRRGCEPRFSTGTGLLLVHSRYCGAEKTKQRVMEADVI